MKKGALIILFVFICIAGAYGKAKPHVTPASGAAESKRCLGMKLNNWEKNDIVLHESVGIHEIKTIRLSTLASALPCGKRMCKHNVGTGSYIEEIGRPDRTIRKAD